MPEPNVITFPCRTLTPIWTGDIDRNSAAVKESGILGSLRFWYEGLLRSKNVDVCGTLGQNEDCECDVCDLFGRTGKARRFRLSAEGLDPKSLFFQANKGVVSTHGAYLYGVFTGKEMNYSQGKSFGLECLWAAEKPLRLEFRFRAGAELERYKALVAVLLGEIATKGGIGAKTQLGFGQIELIAAGVPDLGDLLEYGHLEVLEMAKRRPATEDCFGEGLFTLDPRRFFSLLFEGTLPKDYNPKEMKEIDIGVRAKLKDRPFVPCAFDIRYRRSPFTDNNKNAGLRPRLKMDFSPESARKMLGFVDTRNAKERKGQRAEEGAWASRVHVSHLYKVDLAGDRYKLKIWGDVDDPASVKRTIIDFVKVALKFEPSAAS